MQELIQQPDSHPGFEMGQGRLLYKGWLVLARNSARIPLVFKEFHDTAAGGHSGYFRTYKRIAALLYWERMKKDIQKYAQECEVCQRNKYGNTLQPGSLQTLPVPTST